MIIGITGGIASGKSLISNYLESIGYTVIDCDKISHQAYQDKLIQEKLISIFHTCNRQEIANKVYNERNLFPSLEAIIHPYVRLNVTKLIKQHENEKIVFVDAPVLIEAGFQDLVDKILLIHTEDSIRIQRLIERDGISLEYAKKKMQSQMPYEEKRKYADYIIENNNSQEETIIELNHLLKSII